MGCCTERIARRATLAGRAAVLGLALWTLAVPAPRVNADPPRDGAQPPPAEGPAKDAKPKLGLILSEPKAFQGYTLLAPMSTKTYLIDMQGKVVRTWESDCNPGQVAYLLENGHLLRAGQVAQQGFGFAPGGAGGRIQEFTWEGEVVWDFKMASDTQLAHHDVCKLPNGNVLMIVWEKKTAKEAVAAGRRAEFVGDNSLLPDCVLEVKPTGKTTGQVVWEWHLWDHLVQDADAAKANYGDVATHPELIDVNFGEGLVAAMVVKKDDLDKLKAIGYVGNTPPGRPQRINPDWTHINAVAYNAELDQVMLSVHAFSEIWIIDHSTTKAEAAGHAGGRGGKGGDLLYRWGNPQAYRAGKAADQRLFSQHNAQWIGKGLPGEGHLLVFNNGNHRPGGDCSSVDEIVLPVDKEGRYARGPGAAYGPAQAEWSYTAPKKSDFFSMLISGAQRLPNGNTLICSGINGTVFEVTPDKEVVWKYVNPVKGGPRPGGFPPGSPPQPGQIMPGFLQGTLKLTDDQKKQAGELQKDVDAKLDKLLTDEQKKQLKEPQGFGAPPQTGQLLSPSVQEKLKLTAEQKKQLEEFQKEVDDKLAKLLTDEQKKQLKNMADMMRAFVPGGPRGPGGFPGFGPGGFGGPSGMGNNLADLFRVEAVQKELTLDKEATDKITAALRKVDEELRDQRPQFGGPGGFNPEALREYQRKVEEAGMKALAKVLSDDQVKRLKELRLQQRLAGAATSGPAVYADPDIQGSLKLTDDQKARIKEIVEAFNKDRTQLMQNQGGSTPDDLRKKQEGLTRQAVARAGKVLTAEQKKALDELKGKEFDVSRLTPSAGPGGPGGFGPPGGFGGFGPPGGFGGFGPPGGGSLFRAYRYGSQYAGLAGKDLTPGKTLEELQPKEPEKK
jgi:Spy/CpxP family protein refolding chaperone